MVDLIKWKPFDNLVKGIFDDFSPLLKRRFEPMKDVDLIPPLDIRDTEKEFEVIVNLPGIDKNDLNITIDDGVLTIQGETRKEEREEKDGYVYFERRLGSFERRVRMPEGLNEDSIKAEYKDGVLRLKGVKEKQPEPEVKKITIK